MTSGDRLITAASRHTTSALVLNGAAPAGQVRKARRRNGSPSRTLF